MRLESKQSEGCSMNVHPTKQMIAEHFFQLSKSMPVDKITVQKIVDTANISRQTFYYHFKDLVDLIEWIVQLELVSILEESLNAPNATKALKIFIQHIYDHRDFFNQLRYSKNRVELETLLINAFRSYLTEVIKKHPPKAHLSLADLEIALDYHTHGIIGLLLTHLNKNDSNPDALAQQMARLAGEIHAFN
jgi:probable dihydroxyacetone kinase regulator